MEKLAEKYRSGRLLLKALDALYVALDKPYDSPADNPLDDFFVVAKNVAFFSRCLMIEIVSENKIDLSGTSAIRLAIALGDIEVFQKIYISETQEIRENFPDFEIEFYTSIKSEILERKYGVEWLNVLKD